MTKFDSPNGQRAAELLDSYGLGKMTYEELLPALRSLPRYVPPPAATTPAEMYERADAQYGQNPWVSLDSLRPVPGFPLPHTLTDEQYEECAQAIRTDASVTSAA